MHPQSGSSEPRGLYAIPQKDVLRAGFFWKLLGSLGFVPGGVPEEPPPPPPEPEAEAPLDFFESTTPSDTPTAMRTASVTREPMTCGEGRQTTGYYGEGPNAGNIRSTLTVWHPFGSFRARHCWCPQASRGSGTQLDWKACSSRLWNCGIEKERGRLVGCWLAEEMC